MLPAAEEALQTLASTVSTKRAHRKVLGLLLAIPAVPPLGRRSLQDTLHSHGSSQRSVGQAFKAGRLCD